MLRQRSCHATPSTRRPLPHALKTVVHHSSFCAVTTATWRTLDCRAAPRRTGRNCRLILLVGSAAYTPADHTTLSNAPRAKRNVDGSRDSPPHVSQQGRTSQGPAANAVRRNPTSALFHKETRNSPERTRRYNTRRSAAGCRLATSWLAATGTCSHSISPAAGSAFATSNTG